MDYQVNGHVIMLRLDRGEEVLLRSLTCAKRKVFKLVLSKGLARVAMSLCRRIMRRKMILPTMKRLVCWNWYL